MLNLADQPHPQPENSQRLLNAAQLYILLGYSCIPVHGKEAAVEWKHYQTRRATVEQAQRWFTGIGFRGIAIITGSISQLIVLDLDSPELFDQFCHDYPDLAATHTVRTRRGVHLYFKLPPTLRSASRSVKGADLQSDGRYVVAPPTIIDGHEYKTLRGGMPLPLNERDLRRLQAFLDHVGNQSTTTAKTPRFEAASGVSEPLLKTLSDADLLDLYERLIAQNGRNHALFYTSLRARDVGWTPAAVEALLIPTHVTYPAPSKHRKETLTQRQHEAHKTITSAFSRPPRPQPISSAAEASSTLPNTLREKLLQRPDGAAILRTLEGLLLADMRPNVPFTEAEACRLLANSVGRRSIRRALQALGSDDLPFFALNPPLEPPVGTANDEPRHTIEHGIKPNAQTAGQSGTKIKNRRGRPAKRYLIPNVSTLCQRLGIERLTDRQADPLTRDDLKSPHALRSALELRFIQRRPGQYFQSLLAQRLGVTDRTIRRYHAHLSVHAEPCFIDTYVTWHNVRDLPTEAEFEQLHRDIDLGGLCLQDPAGKRYPPQREIALKLLQQHKFLLLRRQTASFYWVGEVKPASRTIKPPISTPKLRIEMVAPALTVMRHTSSPLPTAVQPPLFKPASTAGQSPAPFVAKTLTREKPVPPTFEELIGSKVRPVPIAPDPAPLKRSRRYFRQPLPDEAAERTAVRVADGTPNLSIFNARRLVEAFGTAAVAQAFEQMTYRQKQGKLRNPAGFMVIVSSMCWRKLNPTALKRPRFEAEPVRHRRKSTQRLNSSKSE